MTICIFLHKVDGLLSHDISSCIAYKSTGNTSPAYADNTVKAATTRHSCYRLIVLKKNIQNGFSDSEDFFH